MKVFAMNLIKKFTSSDLVNRAFHTLWQVALGYVLAQKTIPHSSHDLKLLANGLYAALLSALKTFLLNYYVSRKV